MTTDGDCLRQQKGVQYPFAVNEKVLIKVINIYLDTRLSYDFLFATMLQQCQNRTKYNRTEHTGKQEDP